MDLTLATLAWMTDVILITDVFSLLSYLMIDVLNYFAFR